MNENVKYAVAAVVVVGLSVGGGLYLSRNDRVLPSDKPAVAVAPPAPAPEEPAIKYPLPEPATEDALPALADSDAPAKGVLGELIGKDSIDRFIVPNDLVRHIVVTVDNLTSEKVAERIRPVKPVGGKFAVNGSEESPVLDPANYQRYKPLVQVVSSVDTQRLLASYTRYYPLFQEAYESLGHPPQYFNDRLIEVIDDLLATPDVPGKIALAQPGVLYTFADPKLESRSAGQKALIRMGSANAAIVKAKLRELRDAIVAQKPDPKPDPKPDQQPAK
jgi:hypothetical protein